jgi:8-amino-7-oxononanoate synthase
LYQSGYSANLGTIPAVIEKKDIVISDKNCHASLIDGIRLSGAKNFRFRHNDMDHLKEILIRESCHKDGRIWIITETLFSMDGDCPDLNVLAELSDTFNALLYLDEAHAVGIYGPAGEGLLSQYGLQSRIAVAVFPMGKAPGLSGAFACGNKFLKEILINKSRSFIFSTAQPPLLAAMLSEIIKFFKSEEAGILRKKLFKNSQMLKDYLNQGGISTGSSTSQIIPILCHEDKIAIDIAQLLEEKGFATRSIRPPSVPRGSSRLRLTVHADHTEGAIKELAENIIDFL